MVKRNWTVAAGATAAGTAVVAGFTVAGPLNPPAGPVSPTYKTLAEVEPRVAVQSLPGDALALHVINQPGSYYLTSNLTGIAGKHAIRIAAADVTLDLMGLTIAASPTGQGAGDAGIFVFGSPGNVTIRNGTVRGWNGGAFPNSGGVVASFAANCRVEGLRVVQCSAYGINLGAGGVVSGCLIENGRGIQVASRGVVSDCVVRSGTGTGIAVDGDDALIVNCQVTGAGQFGIHCTGSGRVEGCSVALCGSAGIQVGSGSLVSGCTASANAGAGMSANGASTISGCVAELNGFDGISVVSDSLVIGNTCNANGQAPTNHAGVYVNGSDNRIEGNTFTDNNYGVYTESQVNLVIRNSARSNSILNYRFGVGTVAGPIVTAATIAGSTNPHANYDF